MDLFSAIQPDRIQTVAGSPSYPQTPLPTSTTRPSDDAFIDVIVNA